MAYKALDIARYIINYSNKNNQNITNLKLQKILYYVQAKFIVKTNNYKCFDEEIINWEYGPVVIDVYEEFRSFGRDKLPMQEEYTKIEYDPETNNIKMYNKKFDDSIITEIDKESINEIIDIYSNYTAFSLVTRTHQEDPWIKSERNKIITDSSIKNYFENNQNRLLGE